MRLLNNKFSGIVIGGLYGYFGRIIFHAFRDSIFKFGLITITFIVIVPMLIGSIPMICSPKDKKISILFSIWSPAASVLVFFFLAFLSKIEDSGCIFILIVPYVAGAIIGGILFRFFINRSRKRSGLIMSLFLVPIFASVFESRLPTPSDTYSFTNKTIINTTPDKIWPNIIRVREISKDEYRKGFFYYSGVPRPLYAELDKDTVGATRIGHFQGGLKFIEKVSVWERNKKITFDITVDNSSIGSSVFNNHILKGGHFRFLDASYELRPVGAHQTELSLRSSYELDTKVNGYGAWWGQMMLDDFQGRLLEVVKKRCDNL